jgi:hypothetical protein
MPIEIGAREPDGWASAYADARICPRRRTIGAGAPLRGDFNRQAQGGDRQSTIQLCNHRTNQLFSEEKKK